MSTSVLIFIGVFAVLFVIFIVFSRLMARRTAKKDDDKTWQEGQQRRAKAEEDAAWRANKQMKMK
jgi:hypothetical protein